jgi:hypothetical protein
MKYCYSKRSNASICADAVLSGEATALAEPEDLDLGAVVERLTGQMLHDDAIRYLAHALPKRNAVWWGCLCVWFAGQGKPATDVDAVRAAVRWVLDPSEARRRAAEPTDLMKAVRTAAGALAVAAFWSGGSMSLPDLPVVEPRATLTADCVTQAVLLAALSQGTFEYHALCRQFLALGLEVAEGKNLWQRESAPEEPVQEVELVEEMLAAVGG